MKNNEIDPFRLAGKLSYEQILSNPILDIAARFWDQERYSAFKLMYKQMRVVDDLIDQSKAEGRLSESKKLHLVNAVNDWAYSLRNGNDKAAQIDFLQTMERFQIPIKPWKRFAESMIYDIHHDGFRTLEDFLRYSEGAAVAPVYLHAFMWYC
jgi:phytoene/squalene synthetase